MQQTDDLKHTIVLLAILMILTGTCTPAFAHKVTIFAYVEGGKVYTESYYADGTRCKNSDITVFDRAGHKVLTGKTNEKGEFSFTPPCKGPLTIVLNASLGHRAETKLSEKDLQEGGVSVKITRDTKIRTPKTANRITHPEARQAGLTKQEFEEILNETLDKKLLPIMKLLAESRQHGVSAKDVFAGLGYIFGIMGLAIYIRDIKRQGRKGNND